MRWRSIPPAISIHDKFSLLMEGKAHYCEDIYGRDRDLWEALHSIPGMTLPRPLRPIPAERTQTRPRGRED